jgi:hypothetical protein
VLDKCSQIAHRSDIGCWWRGWRAGDLDCWQAALCFTLLTASSLGLFMRFCDYFTVTAQALSPIGVAAAFGMGVIAVGTGGPLAAGNEQPHGLDRESRGEAAGVARRGQLITTRKRA